MSLADSLGLNYRPWEGRWRILAALTFRGGCLRFAQKAASTGAIHD
jgi:hypothetical protein